MYFHVPLVCNLISHIPDIVVLVRAGPPRIESMVRKSCLRWATHVIPVNDSCLPKQLFYDKIYMKGRERHQNQRKGLRTR